MHAFLTSSGFEAALIEELGGSGEILAPGIVVSRGIDPPLAATDHVFARQLLPEATEVRAASIRRLAAGAVAALLPRLRETGSPWRLEAILADEPRDPNLPGELRRRLGLIQEAFLEELESRWRKVARLRLEGAAPGAGSGDVGEDGAPSPAIPPAPSPPFLVQLLLAERELLLASGAAPMALPRGLSWPTAIPAGRFAVGENWSAPSSAFRKLEEALVWMGRPILDGERVVDLGAAPGGWSRIALSRGARVTAVDRAELDEGLRGHPRLVHERRTGFSYEPEGPPVDWLLCDIIARPRRSLELLERWARARWFRRTIFHLKFQGKEEYALANEGLRILRESGYPLARGKHLFHDRNEVTLWADIAPGK